MKKYLSIILLAAFLIIGKTSLAQSLTSITAVPHRQEIRIDPGEVSSGHVLKAVNNGSSELSVRVKVQDFIVVDDQGTPAPVEADESGRWAASGWVQVSPSQFTLKPGEEKQLDMVIVTPEDALPGGHYAVVFYEPMGNFDVDGSGAAVAPNVGTLLYITVNGAINENAAVRRMDIPSFSEYGPVKINTEIANMSDVHINPVGEIKVYNMLGGLDQTLKLDSLNIFPGTSREYENSWDKVWGFGKYKAMLEAGYGSQGNTLQAVVYFWVLPWKIIAFTALTIAIAVLLIILIKKNNRMPPAQEPPVKNDSFSED